MNEGILLLLVVLATIGSAIAVVWYRDLIWPERYVAPPVARRPNYRRVARPAQRPAPAGETKPKRAETVSATVSGIAVPDNDAEMIAIRTVAKLINAGMITETAALETVFAVRAGSSRRYRAVQAKLKLAQAEQESASNRNG